jgi:predicted transcriptional regulator of viral defense system
MMLEERRRAFSSYLTRLLSQGRLVFTREQACEDLGIGEGAFLDAAERQQRQRTLITPRRGFYVIVPPQYLALGAPPPSFYIHSLMRHEGRPYYVGLLKAAELHGAAHQAVMQFQVVTDKRLPKIKAGRSAIVFYYRKDMRAIANGLQDRKTDTGYFNLSNPELTMLDLLRYPHAGAGLDNIATVFSELGRQIDPQKLADLSASFERSVIQRVGYMLDKFGHSDGTGPLREALKRYASLPWVELRPVRGAPRDTVPEPVERDERWHVIVRRAPEPDI